MYAFGISAYDSNPEAIEDPSYGVLKPYYKTWGFADQNSVEFEQLETRDCTDSEFHVDGTRDPDSQFFLPHRNSVDDITFYRKKLKCLDTDKVEVQGDYNSPKARSFVLLFEKCNNSTYAGVCKSEA